MGAPVSLKAATKAYLKVKNSEKLDFYGTFPKQKRRSAIKMIEVFAIDLASLYLISNIFSTSR